jgi:23S rRNA (uridine2552-2'-O)-methyltransferase
MAAKPRFNASWMQRHLNDPYVRKAQQGGYRSRAAFKLAEIDDQDKLIRPGMSIVELGAAPGSWTQVACQRLGRFEGRLRGRIIAVDMLPMEALEGVEFVLGDFREVHAIEKLEQLLVGRPCDLVISDMAPKLSGIEVADAARMADLVELTLGFARVQLRSGGCLLVKSFQGSGFSQQVEAFKRSFRKVHIRKPKASREESAETYLLGKGLIAAQEAPAGVEPGSCIGATGT